jgi:hypothetical protein
MAVLAGRQHEVVARWQLFVLGFSRHEIRHLVRQGALHRIFPGVFTVGSPQLTREGRWMAAVLACGEDAVLVTAQRSRSGGSGRRRTERQTSLTPLVATGTSEASGSITRAASTPGIAP